MVKRNALALVREQPGSATKDRVLDAAVECLIELGVAGTTTLAVQHRAGVSRGALLHHFPSHADLLGASVAELVRRNEASVTASKGDLRELADPLDAAIRSLAYAARQPAYLAEIELWAVSRSDEVLRRVLIDAERAAKRDVQRVNSDLFGLLAERDAYDDVALLTQTFVMGLAISENIGSSPKRRERLIAAWIETVRPLLEPKTVKKTVKKT